MDDVQIAAALECVLFVAGEPVPESRLAEVLEVDGERVAQALHGMSQRPGGGLMVASVAGGWMLCTRPEYSAHVTRLLRVQPHKLSKAALETLAIIAYRQPITGPEIEAIRGVSADGVLEKLETRGLIREAGRKQAPGRPRLYETTEEFLRYLGIRDLSELPQLES